MSMASTCPVTGLGITELQPVQSLSQYPSHRQWPPEFAELGTQTILEVRERQSWAAEGDEQSHPKGALEGSLIPGSDQANSDGFSEPVGKNLAMTKRGLDTGLP